MNIVTPNAKSTEWRNIPGFSRYQAGNAGEIRRVYRAKSHPLGGLISPNRDRFGYCRAKLINDDGAYVSISFHKVVVLAYIGNVPDGYEINHKNLIKGDNRPENLEVITHHQNIQHSWETGDRRLSVPRGERCGKAKIKENQVTEIRALYRQGYTEREIGKKFGVSHVAIGQIIRGKTWTHVQDEYHQLEQADSELTADDVREIRRKFHRKVPVAVIAGEYKVSRAVIGDIVTGRTWRDVQKIEFNQVAQTQ